MNTEALVEWQVLDKKTGYVYPWLTHPFLELLDTWNLKDITILETGGGRSTHWWRNRCRWVDTIEANEEWGKQIEKDCQQYGLNNGNLFCKTIPEGTPDGMLEYFSLIPKDTQYEIIVVDGIYRTEMVEWAIDHFKGRGGILIADNWQQDFVWISPKAEELLIHYDIHRFVQPNHTNHEGKPWNTCYWVIN
jgi:hypothetical protein